MPEYQSEIIEAIRNLDMELDNSRTYFDVWWQTNYEFRDPSWLIESCFLQLLAIIETLGLQELRKMAHEEYTQTKNSKGGFSKSDTNENGDLYPVVPGRIRCFLRALESFFPVVGQTTVTKDVLQILRDIHYAITDPSVFTAPPSSENDVHLRIECILKCFFPDLKHKPTITKQIKNFQPDTGIPSIETLIEYKYISRKEDVPIIADQILADTRGYNSKDWNRFLYVVYETSRFKSEKDWIQFLRQSDVPKNTSLVVLGGVPPELEGASSLIGRSTHKKAPKTKRAKPVPKPNG